MPDVEYCPSCGESITQQQRRFYEDLVLNRYRTEFPPFRLSDSQYCGGVGNSPILINYLIRTLSGDSPTTNSQK